MSTRGWSLCALALAGTLLAGCAEPGGGTATPGGSVAVSSPGDTPANSADPTGSPSAQKPPTPPKVPPSGTTPSPGQLKPTGGASLASGEMIITGEVVEGVEPGCTLLRTPERLYLLIGGDRAIITSSTRLTARGRLAMNIMTTCQQGTPFQVTDVRKI